MLVKLQNTTKGKNHKSKQGKNVNNPQTGNKSTTGSSTAMTEATQWNISSKVQKENKCQTRILFSAELSLMIEEEIKAY